MFTITLANPKGGSGKTTSAMLLAEQIHHAGGTVAILDCDPNQNIALWAKQRESERREVPYLVRSVQTEGDFFDTLESVQGKADYLIIDLEGTASTIVSYAVSQSDLVLVPFEPTPMEARQAARAAQLVRNTGRMANKTIRYALVLVRVNAAFQTAEEKDVRKEMEAASVPVLETSIVRRAAYTRIFRESHLLSELLELGRAEVANKTASQQERILNPLETAIQNAKAFAQEVVNQLTEKEAAA